MNTVVVVQCLVILLVANGSPLVASAVFGSRCGCSLDHGLRWWDGLPLFGPAKTIRGLVVGVGAAGVAGVVCGLSFTSGAVFGMWAMLGDLVSSFTKRRMGVASSRSVPFLDQLPEALLPLLAISRRVAMTASDLIVIVATFFVLEILLSGLWHRMRVRKRCGCDRANR